MSSLLGCHCQRGRQSADIPLEFVFMRKYNFPMQAAINSALLHHFFVSWSHHCDGRELLILVGVELKKGIVWPDLFVVVGCKQTKCELLSGRRDLSKNRRQKKTGSLNVKTILSRL